MNTDRATKLLIFFVAFYNCATFTDPTSHQTQQKTFLQALTENSHSIEFHPDQDLVVTSHETRTVHTRQPKPWTVLVYMAADNDLRAFAHNNIRQMTNIGSNSYVNILIHMDIRYSNNQKVTRRFFVEKNKVLTQNSNDPATQCMDSGDPQTLISACEWAASNYPADQFALILWNHGTGIIDPRPFKIINPAELFTFNPENRKFELDRTIGFLDLLHFMEYEERGICWDNTTGNYLTNEKFEYALSHICSNILHKKFSLIGFDACLMSMVEVAGIVKNYADIMVGSQEVELGTGWNYHQALGPLATRNADKYELAKNIVGAFQRTYHHITNDFTQSAIDLKYIEALENNIHEIASLLLHCIQKQKYRTVQEALKKARNKKNCTHFDEPSYVDLYCFYSNLEKQVANFSLHEASNATSTLAQKLREGKQLLEQIVFANTVGKNLHNAHGLSIYFPERRIHSSYPKSNFAQQNNWFQFIKEYLRK